jgi:hypothetical protein
MNLCFSYQVSDLNLIRLVLDIEVHCCQLIFYAVYALYLTINQTFPLLIIERYLLVLRSVLELIFDMSRSIICTET